MAKTGRLFYENTSIFSVLNLPYISLTSFNIFVVGFPFQTGRHKFQNIPIWAEDQCETFNFQRFVFYPHSKIHVPLTLTMSIIRMLLLFTKLLQLGLKALTPLSLQPVSLEQEEMTTLQTVLLRLIGLHIKVLPQEEFLVKNYFPLGGLVLFVRLLLFPV